jgi:hypothetical protein
MLVQTLLWTSKVKALTNGPHSYSPVWGMRFYGVAEFSKCLTWKVAEAIMICYLWECGHSNRSSISFEVPRIDSTVDF